MTDHLYLIDVIENSPRVEGKFVGFTGDLSATYVCFERLCQVASDTELFRLTKSKSPVMRVYAARGLEMKNKALYKEALSELKNDTATVWENSGCNSERMSVAWFTANLYPAIYPPTDN